MRLLSEFIGTDQYDDRRAYIFGPKFFVVLEDKKGYTLVKTEKHSLQYSEDAAENWVMGWYNFKGERELIEK